MSHTSRRKAPIKYKRLVESDGDDDDFTPQTKRHSTSIDKSTKVLPNREELLKTQRSHAPIDTSLVIENIQTTSDEDDDSPVCNDIRADNDIILNNANTSSLSNDTEAIPATSMKSPNSSKGMSHPLVGTCIRVGLSRKALVKPLHSNIITTN